MKVVCAVCTVLALLLLIELQPLVDGFPFIGIAIGVLLAGLVLNFSAAVEGSRWKNAGWGMFYGAIAFFIVCTIFLLWMMATGIQC